MDARGADGGAEGRGAADGAAGQAATIPVTYVGGTFQAGLLVLEPLARALPARCRLVPPEREPDLGAVLILRKRLGAA